MRAYFFTYLNLFTFFFFPVVSHAIFTSDSTSLSAIEEKHVVDFVHSLTRRIAPSEQTTYRWQSKFVGESLLKDGIDEKIVFEKKGLVGNAQRLGSGFYSSSNFWDSSGYAPEQGASLVKVILPPDKKVLDLTNTNILAQLQREGITLEDIARFDPKLVIKYRGHEANSNWFCIKDLRGVTIAPFDGQGFSTEDLLNFKIAIHNPTALEVYRKHVSQIVAERKRLSNTQNSTSAQCNTPSLVEKEVKQRISSLGTFYEWNEFGECILQCTDQNAVIDPNECIKHVPSTQVIRFGLECHHYNRFNVLTHTVPLKECPENAEQAPPRQIFDPKINYQRYSRLNPLALPDPMTMPSQVLKRTSPPDEAELKTLKKNHFYKNSKAPPQAQYIVLKRTDKGFKAESFATEEAAFEELKTIPEPIDLDKFLDFKTRVTADFEKDLGEALRPWITSTPKLRLTTQEEIKAELFNQAATHPLSNEQYFNLLNDSLLYLDLSFASEDQVNEIAQALQKYFKPLKSVGFFEMKTTSFRDANQNYLTKIQGQIRGTPFEITLRTHHAAYEADFGDRINKTLNTSLSKVEEKSFQPETVFKNLYQAFATELQTDPQLKPYLDQRVKQAITPILSQKIQKLLQTPFSELTGRHRSDAKTRELIYKKLNPSTPEVSSLIDEITTKTILEKKRKKIRSIIKAGLREGLRKASLLSALFHHFRQDTSPQLKYMIESETEKAFFGQEIKEDLKSKIETVIQDFYLSPMPKQEEVKVTDEHGKVHRWRDLNTDQRKAIISFNHSSAPPEDSRIFVRHPFPLHEDSIPRWIHGPEHIARVAIEIPILAQLYQKQNPNLNITDTDVAIAQYLSAFHDSARQSEGVDLWGDESAENARIHLLKLGLSPELIETCIQDLKQKDLSPQHPRFSERSIISKLIHDADSLDRLRVSGLRAFNLNYLDLYQDYESKKLKKELSLLLKDLDQFIEKTEDMEEKLKFKKSGNYFKTFSEMARDEKSPLKKWLK